MVHGAERDHRNQQQLEPRGGLVRPLGAFERMFHLSEQKSTTHFCMVARPVAIWGPAILAQIQGELSAGICTFSGQLRIVCASHDPLADYLVHVRDVLDAAC
jgi:hypothetical protein